jgi:uncharacterized protein (DUF983 family)
MLDGGPHYRFKLGNSANFGSDRRQWCIECGEEKGLTAFRSGGDICRACEFRMEKEKEEKRNDA